MIALLIYSGNLSAQQVYEQSLMLMGSNFSLKVVADSEAEGTKYLNLAIEEISRIEKLISSWDSNSQTSEVNRNSGIQPLNVDPELYGLIERSLRISKLTDGAFDITYASMDNIWKFDGTMTQMPTKIAVAESISKVGYHNIILDKEQGTVFLKNRGMKIGFGAIGKGYAADRAKEVLKSKGVSGGIINASGDLVAWGNQPDGSSWTVGITNPLNKEKIFSWLPVNNQALVTSGNYEKFVTIDGVKYSHIIDPRTGYPSKGLLSVSVLTNTGELGDALATAVFVMGVEVGLDFINQVNGVECILVDELNKMHFSKNLNLNKKEL